MSSNQLEAMLLEIFADGVFVSAKELACREKLQGGTFKTVKDVPSINVALRSLVRSRATEVSRESISVFAEALTRETHPLAPYKVFSGASGNTVLRVSGTCMMPMLLLQHAGVPLISNKRLTKAQCTTITSTMTNVKNLLNSQFAIEFHLGRAMVGSEVEVLANHLEITRNKNYVIRQAQNFKQLLTVCRQMQTATYPNNPEESEFPPIVVEGTMMGVSQAKFDQAGTAINTITSMIVPDLQAVAFNTTRQPKDGTVIKLTHYLNPTAGRVYAAILV